MNKLFQQSVIYKILNFLFINNNKNLFIGSKILKLLSKINLPKLSLLLLVLSILFFWYELLFVKIGAGWVDTYNFASIFLVLSLLFCDKKRLKLSKPVFYLLCFLFIMLVSGLVASINGAQMGMIISGILLFIQFIMAYIVSSTYLNKYLVIDLMLFLSLPIIVLGLLQGVFGENTSRLWVSTSESLINIRVSGLFSSPNVFAGLLMFNIIMSFFALLEKKQWHYFVYIMPALAVLGMTFSRSAWVGLVIGVSFSLLIKNWRLIVLVPVSLISLIIPSIRQRIFTAVSTNYLIDSAIDGRIWSLNSAIEIFKNSPILGTGPGSYGGQTALNYNSSVYLTGMQNGYVALAYTDNQWIQIIVQTGLLGILSFGGFVLSYLINNIRQYIKSKNMLCLAVLAVIIALVVSGLFQNILEFGAVAVLAGVYLGLGNDYER